ncbi:MAG TPA: methionine--tRNA ligase, partial [Thermoplasmata archaeon]|nr:methionine--tRNA ligase [Thermoplasmata archaeon]
MARIFVGVAWPYANGPFHMGHLAGAYLPGDAFARFHRLRGDEVLLVSGSDMHGTPILVRAEKEGTTPEAIARRFDEINRAAFERLGFSFDRFTETHTIVHERTVQELFLKLLEGGFVDRRTEENAYCAAHGRFLPDRYLVGTCPHCGFQEARGDECPRCGRALGPRELGLPRCLLDGSTATFRPSEHFFLRLDKLSEPIARFRRERPHLRPNVANITDNFLREGLRPTPITRDLDWGVPIPLEGYGTKRFYVWFDALIGYLSASKEWAIRAGRPDAWRRYWSPAERVRHYYFIGKDNIFHHAVLWPGLLSGVGDLPLPYDIPANEWLVVGGQKLAKSDGPERDATIPALLERFPPDQIRFYAALLAPQNHDTEFDWEEFQRVHDEILANQYGNLVQRVLSLIRDREGGRIPGTGGSDEADADRAVGERIRLAHEEITEAFEHARLKEALGRTLEVVREANRRFHDAKPWSASDVDRRRAIREAVWAVSASAVWLAPFLPFSSDQVFRMLGHADGPGPGDWERVLSSPEAGLALGELRPLFPKPPKAKPTSAAPARGGPKAEPVAKRTGPVPLDIRAALVTEAAPHPSADRLYVVSIDDGSGTPRQVVAGLRPFYRVDELRGRRVALLANLRPRTIRSIESRGMLLAAESDGRPFLLEPPKGSPLGAGTWASEGPAPTIEHAEFLEVPLAVGRVLESTGGLARVDLGARTVEVPGLWVVGELVVVRGDP